MNFTPSQMRELRQADSSATGNRLAKAMAMAELTQAELAAALDLAQPYVSDVVRGRHQTITLENAYKFCGYFGCDVRDLFPPRKAEAA